MASYTNESIDRLMKAIALTDTPEECRALFEDLCTIKEIQNMAMRLDTAIMISKGENYQEISKQVGASTATISRVSRSYYYGSDGYKKTIERLNALEKNAK
jgi:TrpR-related protein YerC/YecD